MTDHTTAKITDAAVARLPIHEGRAELLEDIMATTPLETTDPATDRIRHDDPRSPYRRWLPVLAAAAAVAAIAAGGVWVAERQADAPRSERPQVATAPGSGQIAVLEADGWTLENASVHRKYGGELSYRGDAALDATPGNGWGVTLDIMWIPAEEYADRVEDREHITLPPAPGEPVEVLGMPAQLWAYSRDDHTVIREVVGDFAVEVRGSGMLEADFLRLLGQLEAIDPGDLDAHLPEEFVTDAEREDVIAAMLAPIPVPDGFDPDIESEEIDRYQLGADVTGAVTCAWLDQYTAARKAGDDAAQQEAADAMATSREWPVLLEMADSGEFSDVIWEMADHMAAGDAPRDWAAGIGCED